MSHPQHVIERARIVFNTDAPTEEQIAAAKITLYGELWSSPIGKTAEVGAVQVLSRILDGAKFLRCTCGHIMRRQEKEDCVACGRSYSHTTPSSEAEYKASRADKEECVFCEIVDRTREAERVCEKPSWIAFHDSQPQAPIHIVVVPKEHVPRLTSRFPSGGLNVDWTSESFLKVIADVAEKVGLSDYRIVINNGPGAGQRVKHLHAHILGGWSEGEIPRIVLPG